MCHSLVGFWQKACKFLTCDGIMLYMRLESIENLPLDTDEKIWKNAYETGDKSFWAKGISFQEYSTYVSEGLVAIAPTSHYFFDKSQDKMGLTIEDVKSISKVTITRHRRYSYPVMHNHNYVEIVYIARGHCTNCFEGYSFEMNEGDVCIMAPSSVHALSCTNDESIILNMMMSKDFFDQSFLGFLRGGKVLVNYLENILYQRDSSPYVLFPTGRDPWLNEIAIHLLTEITQQPHAYEYSTSLLTSEFLLHLVREYEMMAIVPNQKTQVQNNLIVAVIGYLSVNYNKATLENTAGFFGYSTAYLSRLIHKHTGKTFNSIITELQMEHAIEMFKNGKTNLTEVAQEVGCFDSSHFSKKFKAVYGIAPTKYIEELKQ